MDDGNCSLNSPPRPCRQISFPGTVDSSLVKTSFGTKETTVHTGPCNVATPLSKLNMQIHHQPSQIIGGDFPGQSSHNSGNIGDFEGQQVDKAVIDLPSVFSEVSSMQKGQSTEIQKQQKLLETLKKRVEKGEEKKDEMEKDVSCVTNKIYMLEETINDSNKNVKILDSEIKVLVLQLQEKELHVSHVEEKIDAEISKLNQHKKIIVTFAEQVKEHEQTTCGVYTKLQHVKNNMQMLTMEQEALDKDKEETDRVLSGTVEMELHSEMDDIKTRLLDAGNEARLSMEKIAEERQRQRQSQQTVQVLQKRNTAQMTRLKRQIKEMQMKNRQRQSQVSQLQEKIAQAAKQLDQ